MSAETKGLAGAFAAQVRKPCKVRPYLKTFFLNLMRLDDDTYTNLT